MTILQNIRGRMTDVVGTLDGKGISSDSNSGWQSRRVPGNGVWFGPAAVLGLVVLLLCRAASAACFTVPLMQGQDPEVAVKDGIFHLVQSDGCNIHLRASPTLGGLATATDQIILSPGCSNLWAPEIHWINNKWYLYYSLGRDTSPSTKHRVYAAESQGTAAAGPYTIRGVLFNGFWNIDGSVFTANNDRLYFIFSGSPGGAGTTQNIYIAPMSNPYTLSGAPVMISQPTQPWEVHGAPPAVNEGPFGFVHNGRTFIVYSASGCWTDDYCLGLLTLIGTNLLDPNAWTKSGPVFTKQPGAYGPGHDGVFTDPNGQWWNIYHANDLSGQGCGGYRQLRVQRIFWNANNMPVFGSPVPIGSWISDNTNFLDAEFPLTETGGTNAANTACGPAGILVGAPVWANPGLRLNGTNEYVDCGAGVANDVQNALTLAAWIRADAFTDWAGIITKGVSLSPFAMQLWHDGSLRFTANWGSPGGSVGRGSWNSNTKMTTNQWYYVAVTYDGATIRFYINGRLDSNQPAAALQFGVVNEPLTLGADFPGAVEYFKGTIRDARVYGRALGQSELLAVAGINLPPEFLPVTNAAIVADQNLAIACTATDPNQPRQTLTYNLVSGPAGASVDPTNGDFTWRPTLAQAPSTNLVTIAVTDNGAPPLKATESFTVTVRLPVPPVLTGLTLNSPDIAFNVSGDLGPDYAVWNSTNLSGDWTLLFVTNPSVMPFQVSLPFLTNTPQRFYRIGLGP